MRVAGCFITKNEEERLPVALESIKNIVDEIIVVDTGSSDKTIAIAKSFGAKVYDFTWQDDFAKAKNFAISKAEADWIIFLDADEYFVEGCQQSVVEYMQQYLHSDTDALGCKKINIDLNAKKEIGSFPEVRIFKSREDIKYTGMIHEHLVSDKKKLKFVFLPEAVLMYHTGYSTIIVKSKLERNLKILKKEMQFCEKNIHYRYLCDCYHGLGEWEKAYRAAKIYVDNFNEADILGINTPIYEKLIYSLQQFSKDSNLINQEIKQAIKLYPKHSEFYMQYADFLAGQSNFTEALKYYLQALDMAEHNAKELVTNNFNTYKPICCLRIGNIYFEQNELSLAAEYYVKALQGNKYMETALAKIIEILGDSEECIVVLNNIYQKDNYFDMTFLENSLDRISIGKIYLYYAKYFLRDETNPLKKEIYMKLAAKNYTAVNSLLNNKLKSNQVEIFFACVNEPANKADLSICLVDNYKVLFKCYQAKCKKINAGLLNEYINLLAAAVLADNGLAKKLLELITFVAKDVKLAAIQELLKYEAYELALQVYANLNERELTCNEIGEKGICLYKNKQYNAAQECFRRASQKGQLSNKGQSFYQWSCENAEKYKSFTSIVMLTYNQLEYTKLCVESIRKYTQKNSYEFIIVDNNSTDGTVEWLKQQPDIRVIYNQENAGFPKGCNQGIAIAKGTEVLLLNNDTIVTAGWLERLKQALYSESYIGAVGAISNSCANFQQIPVEYKAIGGIAEFAQKVRTVNNGYWEQRAKLIGFCMLIKRTAMDEIGLLDERFFPGNFEDDDYSYRLKAAGYQLLLCYDVFIHHFGSISFRAGEAKAARYKKILSANGQRFQEKWGYSWLQMFYLNTSNCNPSPAVYLKNILRSLLEDDNETNRQYVKEGLNVADYDSKELFSLIVEMYNEGCLVKQFDGILLIGQLMDKSKALALYIEAYKNNYRNEALLTVLIQSLLERGNTMQAEKIIAECEAQLKENEHYGLNKNCLIDIKMPLVSILIPTYNRLEMFKEAFNGALKQTYPNIEIVVCDNSTNEETFAYMQLFKQNKRVKYLRNRLAKSKQANFAPFEEIASGEYIQWLMDDDVIAPNKLEIMLTLLLKNPHAALATSHRLFIDEQSNKLENQAVILHPQTCILNGQDLGRQQLITMHNDIGEPSAVLFKRTALKNHYWQAACRGYKAISDIVMWLELMEKGHLIYVAEPLSSFRKHSGQEQDNINVYLSARNEWFELAKEYFARKIYIKTVADYKNFLYNFIVDSLEVEKNLQKYQDIDKQSLYIYKANLKQAKEEIVK